MTTRNEVKEKLVQLGVGTCFEYEFDAPILLSDVPAGLRVLQESDEA